MAMDDDPIRKQIKVTVDQMTQIFLFEISKKYNLPTKAFGSRKAPQTVLSPIETGLYRLEVKTDFHQVKIELTLHMDEINETLQRHATKRTPEPDWAFLAFIKEGAFTLANVKKCKDLEALTGLAAISTQMSGAYPIPKLTRDTLYSALFFVAVDTDERWEPESHRLAPLQLPAVPSIDQITELKGKLNNLLSMEGGKSINCLTFP
jgi:hypothetical protein